MIRLIVLLLLLSPATIWANDESLERKHPYALLTSAFDVVNEDDLVMNTFVYPPAVQTLSSNTVRGAAPTEWM